MTQKNLDCNKVFSHGSLFSGIGGFDLAAEWVGWENVFHCEWMPFPRQVLKYHFPNSISYEDITKTDFTIHRGSIDILTGGFPCQPYSLAGKRKGTEDSRHLWPEMLRAIREIQPKWILGENVFGIVNWSGGLVFEQVQSEMEAEGYEVQPFVIPACAKDAPHRRDRTWFVAYCGGEQLQERTQKRNEQNSKKERARMDNRIERHGYTWDATDTNSKRLERSNINGSIEGKWKKQNKQLTGCIQSNFQNFPTQSPVRKRDDGLSYKLLIFVVKELYDKISNTSKENRIKNLSEVWKGISSQEVWEQIRGLYSLESKEILFQTMQLYSTRYKPQNKLSPFSPEVSKPILQHLSKYGEFRYSPHGQELEKQRHKQFGNTLSFLPHEVALAARRFETAIAKFEAWHRNESIKAYGNAVVPQVVFEIFKAIQRYEDLH